MGFQQILGMPILLQQSVSALVPAVQYVIKESSQSHQGSFHTAHIFLLPTSKNMLLTAYAMHMIFK